jgi:hypothetical protein
MGPQESAPLERTVKKHAEPLGCTNPFELGCLRHVKSLYPFKINNLKTWRKVCM